MQTFHKAKTAKIQTDNKSIFYPPGGILIWIIIFVELMTFSFALIAMAVLSKSNTELFHSSRQLLSTVYGTINTIVLLTSGYFMATAVQQFKKDDFRNSSRHVLFTIFFGLAFIAIKTIEYSHKLSAGIDLDYNLFFTFYWLLTGFHLLHVVLGLVILTAFYISMKKKTPTLKTEDMEAGTTFWHMCDLIWLLIFPVIYLLF